MDDPNETITSHTHDSVPFYERANIRVRDLQTLRMENIKLQNRVDELKSVIEKVLANSQYMLSFSDAIWSIVAPGGADWSPLGDIEEAVKAMAEKASANQPPARDDLDAHGLG